MTLDSISQTLRAVGQALEEQHLEDFELENHDGDFLVRGRPGQPQKGEKLIQEIFRRLQRPQGGVSLELHYTPQDIDCIERKGRERRRNGSKMPDFYTLSQLLRTVGAYIDEKGGRLFGISRQESRLTLRYQKSEGEITIEAQDIPSFYDFFLQMSLHRSFENPPSKSS